MSQFPTTQSLSVTPGKVFPLPPIRVQAFEVLELSNGTWLHLLDEFHEVELPLDFYLKEMLDVIGGAEPPKLSAVEFANTWGVFVDFENRDISPLALERAMSAAMQRRELVGDYEISASGLYVAKLDAATLSGLVAEPVVDPNDSLTIAGRAVSDERAVAAYFKLVHPCELEARVSILVAVHEVVNHWRGRPGRGGDEDIFEHLGDEFLDSMNRALTPFAPKVSLSGWSDSERPHVANVAALQVANDIVKQLDEYTCQNETCGRQFTQQRGTAEFGQYRTKGVMYCSKSCAKAQNARNFRRNEKAKKLGAENG